MPTLYKEDTSACAAVHQMPPLWMRVWSNGSAIAALRGTIMPIPLTGCPDGFGLRRPASDTTAAS